ncbi:MAG: RNA 2',3'-cyclic phosphodiesterase [Deltaproteobacteria bacterium]|nr:RNA 2',3'-cyclic phosphodiesterase [Deltaproteobacteria bacterium]RLA91774.1 MAG: RNA 2',3'-cyclic phosphodiesterase [Deltaproteobacteria bacterium]
MTKEERLRSFLAIDINPEIKGKIAKAIEKFHFDDLGVRWVKSENLHLTIKFFGSITNNMVDKGILRLTELLKGFAPFNFKLSGVGAFPTITNPKVIWLGVSDGNENITVLWEMVENSLSALGFKKENRNFSPHLTIGRMKSAKRKKELIEKLIKIKDIEFGEVSAKYLSFYKSDLRPTGPIYTCLAQIPFGGKK